MTMNVVIIDDERTFANGGNGLDLTHLRTSNEALAFLARVWTAQSLAPVGAYIHENTISELWLDHDLGDGDDIMIVVRFLRELARFSELPIQRIYVHTQNPVGAENIISELRDIGIPVQRCGLPGLE